jgi:signal transduction histidine kinase
LTRPAAAADAVAALVLSVGALVDVRALDTGSPVKVGAAAALALACTLSVAARRSTPVAAATVALASATAYQVLARDPRFTFEPYAVLLVMYLLGRTELDGRRLPRAVLVAAAVAFAVIAASTHGGPGLALSAFGIFAVGPYSAGAFVARRARAAAELEGRIELLVSERELRTRQAAADERLRLARELHDVAAHCLTEMVVQAGAARMVLSRDLSAAEAALRAVHDSGQATIAELTRLVEDSQNTDVEERSRLLGLVAEIAREDGGAAVSVTGESITIPGPVDVVAWSVLREAWTNAARHAPGSSLVLTIDVRPDVLELSVVNGSVPPGRHASYPAVQPGGYGLIGMRERVTSIGGTFGSRPTRDGGYAVHAELPMTSQQPSPPSRSIGRRVPWSWLTVAAPAIWLVILVGEAISSPHRSGPVVLNVLVVAAMAAACTLRRRAPIAFLVVVGALALVLSDGLTSRSYATLTGLYAVSVPAYAVASWRPRSRAVAPLLAYAVVMTGVGVALGAGLAGIVGPLLALVMVTAAGMVARSQRELRQQLEVVEQALQEQTRRLEEIAARRERIAVTERQHALVLERVERMLRLSDEATRLLRSTSDPSAALAGVEAEGRSALASMREILGTLRATRTDDASPGPALLARPEGRPRIPA